MSQPPIIGSGKPHTVTLKPGSNVAVSTPPRGPEETGQADGGRREARLRSGPDPERAARIVTPALTPAPARPHRQAAEPAHAPAPAGLSDAVLQRIQQLKQRNNVVGETLAGLPAGGLSAR